MTLKKSGSGGLGRQLERFAAEFIVWNRVIDFEFDAEANRWFSSLKLSPISEYLVGRGETPQTLPLIEHWLDEFFEPEEVLLLDQLVQKEIRLLGNPTDVTTSVLGRKVIEALDVAGLTWRFASLPQFRDDMWPSTDWKVADLPKDDMTKIEVYYQKDEQISVLQYLRILKDKRGKETAIWFTPQLVASRPMHQITRWFVNNSQTGALEFDEVPAADLGRVLNIGEWSEQIALPVLFKKLFFLAERQDEGTEASQTRQTRYSHLAETEMPKPVLFFEKQANIGGTWTADSGEQIYSIQPFPHVANQGWIFQDSSVDSMAETFKIFHEGSKRVQYVLTNAYQSHFTMSRSGSWDRYTLCATLMVAQEQKRRINGAGFWFPALIAGEASAVSVGEYNPARSNTDPTQEEESNRVMARLSERGIGPVASSAINTFAFSQLLPEGDLELAKRLLELAALMEVPKESTNAVSNWGIALYMENELDAAEQKFKEVLDSEYAEKDEAFAYLAQIARLRGDSDLAAKYDQLCQEAGGYSPPLFEQLATQPQSDIGLNFEYSDEADTDTVVLTKNSHSGLGLASSDGESSDSESSTTAPLSKSNNSGIGVSSGTGGEPAPESGAPRKTTRAKFCGQCGRKFDAEEDNFCITCGNKR